ncbi:MAG: FxsA family protein [Pseudomonadota bacterium]
MPLLILFAFIAVPIIEIALFIELGGWLGLWPTLALVILTAVVGTALIRVQGLAVMERARVAMDRGEPPVGELFHGACLLVAGALLLTPGFLTDTLGLALLVPPIRVFIGNTLWRALAARAEPGHPDGAATPPPPGPGVIDGEFEDVTPGPEDQNSVGGRPDAKSGGRKTGGKKTGSRKPKTIPKPGSPWSKPGKRAGG